MENYLQPDFTRSNVGIYDPENLSSANKVKVFREKKAIVNQFLAELPNPVFEKLQPFLRSVQLTREDYVYQPDDEVSYLYFPETAVFTEYQMLKDGRTIEIALTSTESAVGLASMNCSCDSTNWTQVCVTGSAVRIESERFRSIAGQDSGVRDLANKHLNSYIRQISHKVICNAHHLVEQRLCTWLLMLQDRCGRGPIQVTQEQLARTLGVYRPSITYIAQRLRERNIIDYTRGRIALIDPSALVNAACSCYSEFSPRQSTGMVYRSSERHRASICFQRES